MIRTLIYFCCFIVWVGLIAANLFLLLTYEAVPGAAEKSPPVWPKDTAVQRESNHFTLVLAAHPRCPCTRVTLGELALILEKSSIAVDLHVLFFKPRDSDWMPTDLWHSAAHLPGAHLAWDEDGIEAQRFGAKTSGHTLLYDDHGVLLFSGGLTAVRGHHGPSKGNHALAAWLSRDESADHSSLVFGCSLTNSPALCNQGSGTCSKP